MDDLQNFWDLVVEVWTDGVWGLDVGVILTALAIFVGFLLIRKLFSRFVMFNLHQLAKRTETELDDKVIEALDGPLRFIPIVMGFFFALNYLPIAAEQGDLVARFLRSLVAFNIFWAIYAVIGPFTFLFGRLERIFTAAMVDWLIKTVKMLIIFIGAAAILEIWGIAVGPLLAGLGLFGVAVALGAQDLFKNLISGLLILAEKRFHKGDWIKVDGVVEGTVEHIGFRSTHVRRFDKAPVFVPNAQLSDSVVTNFSAMTHRRIKWLIGVTYDTDVDQLRQIRDGIDDYIKSNEAFAPSGEVSTFVRIDSFGPSSIDILLYCFTKTTVWAEWLKIKEELAYEIMQVVEGAGSSFAFPSQSLYVESLPGEAPEVFVPPGQAEIDAPKE